MIRADELVWSVGGDPKVGQRFEHVASGGVYEVVGIGLSANDARERVVIYRNVEQPPTRLWVRSLVEFTDGRYRPVPANE